MNRSRCPPRGKLPESEIVVLERWVKDGGPRSANRGPHPTRPARAGSRRGPVVALGVRNRSPIPPAPRVKDEAWPRSDVDRFILAGLESEGLTSRRRRRQGDPLCGVIFFDLIGLPPTPAEIEVVHSRTRPRTAFEEIVDEPPGHAPNSARAGAVTGSTSRVMPTPRRFRRELHVFTRLALSQLCRQRASTPTSHSTGSSPSNSPATCSPSSHAAGAETANIAATGVPRSSAPQR